MWRVQMIEVEKEYLNLYTWNQYNFFNQCNPNKLNKKEYTLCGEFMTHI